MESDTDDSWRSSRSPSSRRTDVVPPAASWRRLPASTTSASAGCPRWSRRSCVPQHSGASTSAHLSIAAGTGPGGRPALAVPKLGELTDAYEIVADALSS